MTTPSPDPAPGGPAEPQAKQAEEVYKVTTLELFFDLVFVFIVTQLTEVLLHELSPLGLLRTLLIFIVLWWLYGGYAWLTNTVAPTDPGRRLLLLAGMAGFLVVGLATPDAFGKDAVMWGIGYLVLVVVHGGLYIQANRKFWGVLPFNLMAAAFVITAGLVSGVAVYVLWVAAALVPIAATYFLPAPGRFSLRAAHIVERHGLIVLVTLGETIVAIGIGLADQPLTAPLLVTAVLGLALSATLWWAYFVGDDERAEEVLTAADDGRRTQMILLGYFYAHIPLLLGIVVMAAGIKKALGHPWEAMPAASAVALAGGVALFLAGDVAFRRVLGMRPYALRAGTALLAAGTVALGIWLAAAVEMLALLVVLSLLLVAESRRSRGTPVPPASPASSASPAVSPD
jgi:low temperature requirement protein LtrA